MMELYKQRKRRSIGKVKRAQWFTVEAPSPEKEIEETPVLLLQAFTRPTHINYKVKVGATKTQPLLVRNPLEVPQHVYLEKFPFEKGFSIDQEEFTVPPLSECTVEITWRPEKSVSSRETVLFKSSSGLKVQAYLLGTACSPKKRKLNTTSNKKTVNANLKNTKKSLLKNKEISGFTEDKKENIVKPSSDSFASYPILPTFPTPQSNISLKPMGSDSPIRRQTYTINCMLRESRIGSELKALPGFSLVNENELILKERKTESNFNFDNVPAKGENRWAKTAIRNVIEIEQTCKDILNDSLEVQPSNPPFLNDNLPACTSSVNVRHSLMDDVKVFDSSAKHLYFGFTPVQSDMKEGINSTSDGSFHFKKSEMDYFKDRKKSINPSTVFLNSLNAKSKIMPGDKRLTFKADAATVGNCSGDSKQIHINTTSNMGETFASPALPVTEENLEDSLLISPEQKYIDSLSPEIKEDIIKEFINAASPPPSYSDIILDEHQPKALEEDLEQLDTVKTSNGAVAFQIEVNSNPNQFKIPRNYKSLPTKTKQPTKVKQKRPSRTLIKDLKLVDTSSKKTPDNKPTNKSSKITGQDSVDSVFEKNKKKPSRSMSRRFTMEKQKGFEIHHRNPYASFNAYYDEYWMEKQEAAFTNWLNFILTPNDDFRSSEDVKVNCAEIWVESMKDAASVTAPSKEDLSLKTYTAAKQLNRLRRSACLLYQSDNLAVVIKKIEREVDVKKISVRKDRAIHADLGIKKDLLDMLLSYNPLWLRIGLETVYGEMIVLQSNSDVVGLSRFIIYRFLSNPDIVAKFSYSAIRNYYKPGYEDEMKRFTLKKFLLLVFFLDEAKRAHLIDHNPCLFSKRSQYKCSRDLLLTFSREYLCGEGDITKHLRYLGCVVKHEQAPIEEFDYAVRNIAVDLRCGLRLGRVVELLLQDWTVSKCLRVNTLNRLAKIHNNSVILKALETASITIEGNIDARDIVDGNREKTLSLLWQIIFKTQISKNVSLEALKKENSYLRRSLKLNADFAAFEALVNGQCETKEFEKDFLNSKLYKENEVIQQLLQWCQNVAAHYGVKVYNFTSSFSDGRALCLLLHHYHPNLLPEDKIQMETSSSFFLKQMEASEDESSSFLADSKLTSGLKDKLMKNEKENLDLVSLKFQEIGQIPILSFPLHVPNSLPDEKVIITLVSYINIRLMELSVEIRAARTIWLAYRNWCLRKKQHKLKVQIIAACKIQKWWWKVVAYKRKQKEEKAATIIQRTWKLFSAVRKLKELKKEKQLKFMDQKAIVIQAAYRSYKARKHHAKCQMASIILQRNIKMWLAKCHYSKLKRITLRVQNIYRAKVLGRYQRQNYLNMKSLVVRCQAIVRGQLVRNKMRKQIAAAVIIQSHFRGFLRRSKFKKEKAACLIIQSNLRRFICRKQFLKQKKAAKILQSHFKAVLVARKTRNSYLQTRKSVIAIQALARGWIIRKYVQKIHCAATKIQSAYKRFSCRKHYLQQKLSVIILQRRIRSYLQFKASERKRFRAAVVIQSLYRSYSERKTFMAKKSACLRIQAHFRRHIIQEQYRKKRKAAILLQRHFRAYSVGKKIRESYLEQRKSSVVIQAFVRGWMVRKHIKQLNSSAIKIQSRYRSYILRKYYLKQKEAANTLQRHIRIYLHKMAIERKRVSAAVTIQSYFRSYIARKQLSKLKSATLFLQSYLRMHICRRDFVNKKNSAIVIQTYLRATLIAKQTRKSFLHYKKNVITIQALVRGWSARSHLQKLHTSAVRIQSAYRSYTCRKFYFQQRHSAIIIQRVVRKYLEQKAIERKRNAAAVVIQSYFRQFIATTNFRKKRSACILIQSHLRKQICQRRFLRMKRAAIVIQNHYRAFRIGSEVKKSYMKDRKHVITVQAVFKGWLTRRRIEKLNKSATLIQTMYRSYICRKSYKNQKQSAIILQKYIRSYLSKKAMERKRFAAAIVIQSNFRGYTQRLKYRKEKSACIVIQSYLRKILCRDRFLRQKKAATAIQNYYRAYKVGTKTKECYLKDRKHIIVTQAVIRGWLMRRYVQKLHKCAITIQATYRSYICKKIYLKKKQSAIILQQCIRSFLLKKANERKQFSAAVLIQSNFRGYMAKSKFKRQRAACIVIQAHLRQTICRNQYLKQKKAATVIQNYYRAFKIGSQVRNCYLKDKKHVISVQAVVKGWLTRKYMQKLHKSATAIQTVYRSHYCRKNYLKQKRSAIILQKCIRSYLNKKTIEKRRFSAAVVIQSNFKAYIARLKFKRAKSACIVIQSYLRQHIHRNIFLKQKQAVIVIQKHFRSKLLGVRIRQSYLNYRKSVVTAQAIVRGWLSRRYVNRLHSSATKIQTAYRSFICTKKYLQQKNSAIILQKHIRTYLYRKAVERKKHASATIIQAAFRGYKTRSEFIKQKAACIVIQSCIRRHICQRQYVRQRLAASVIQQHFKAVVIGRKARNEYLNDRKHIITAQAVARGWLVRRRVRLYHFSATKIQNTYRAYMCKKLYLKKKQCAITIQKHFKAYMLGKRLHNQYVTLRQSSIIIQTAWRDYRAKYQQSIREKAATLLQSHIRKILAQKKFMKMKQSAILIQRYYLAYKAGLKEYCSYREKVKSCVKIQACVRGYMIRKRLGIQVKAAVLIQQAFRRWKEKKALSEARKMDPQYLWYLHLRASVIAFQRQARLYLQRRTHAAVRIQTYVRMWLARKNYRKEIAALKIQALWRAYSVRRSITNKRIIDLRKNIEKVRDKQNQLKHRTTRALKGLQGTNLRDILFSLKNLDASTRLSPTCCERLQQSEGLSKLITLMSNCNRSVPHQEIIKLSTNILLNLAKYQKTVDAVWAEEGALDVVLELMRTYRDKPVDIFSKCCSLFWIFNQDPVKAAVLKDSKSFLQQIQSFHSMWVRKKKLESKRVTTRPTSMNTTKKDICTRESLTIDPEWMLGRHRRREFEDPYIAISSLMHSLGLSTSELC